MPPGSTAWALQRPGCGPAGKAQKESAGLAGPTLHLSCVVTGASSQLGADARGQLQAAGWQRPSSGPAGQGLGKCREQASSLASRNADSRVRGASSGCWASEEATAPGTGHHPASFSRRNTEKGSGLRCPASALSVPEEEGVARREMGHQGAGRSPPPQPRDPIPCSTTLTGRRCPPSRAWPTPGCP